MKHQSRQEESTCSVESGCDEESAKELAQQQTLLGLPGPGLKEYSSIQQYPEQYSVSSSYLALGRNMSGNPCCTVE